MSEKMHAPKSEAEVAQIIASSQDGLNIVGGGTRAVGRSSGAQTLSTSGLNGIKLYEPGAMTMVAQVGTPVAEVEAVLTAQNQRLAFEPMDHRALLGTTGTPTIGGVFATNTSGPRRVQVGAARDFALGVRFVDGAGEIVSNGGRVMKNVTGYDLVKLMSGSWGTLGVLTEVSFKTLPNVETQATLQVETKDPKVAVQAMSAALGSPYDVMGAAYLDERVFVRVEGFETSVAYRVDALQNRLAQFGAVDVMRDAEAIMQRWRDIRDVTSFAGGQGDVWRISVKPTDGPAVIEALQGGGVDCYMDWGGGLVWAQVPKGTDVRARLLGIAGHATCVRGHDYPAFAPQTGAILKISQGIRAKFDPRGLLNPWRMG